MDSKVKEACERLTRHNKWRRGEDGYDEMCNPTQLGKDIEMVIKAAQSAEMLAGALKDVISQSDRDTNVYYRAKEILQDYENGGVK